MTPIPSARFTDLPSDCLIAIAQFLGPDCFFRTEENWDETIHRSLQGGFFLINRKIYALGPRVRDIFTRITVPETGGLVREALSPLFKRIHPYSFIPSLHATRRLDTFPILQSMIRTDTTDIAEPELNRLLETLIMRKRPLAAACAAKRLNDEQIQALAYQFMENQQHECALFVVKFVLERPKSFCAHRVADQLSTYPNMQEKAFDLINELEEGPPDYNLWPKISRIYIRCHRFDEALFSIRLLPLEERNPLAQELAKALRTADQLKKAQQALDLMSAPDESHRREFLSWSSIAQFYINCNQLDAALWAVRVMGPLDRNDLAHKLAEAFQTSGQPEKAQQALSLIRFVPFQSRR